MLAAPAPGLSFVIGVPFGLLVLVMLVGTGIWWMLGKANKG